MYYGKFYVSLFYHCYISVTDLQEIPSHKLQPEVWLRCLVSWAQDKGLMVPSS